MDGLYPGPEAFAGLVTAPVFKIGEAFKPNAWWVRFPSASAIRRGDNPLREIQGRPPRGAPFLNLALSRWRAWRSEGQCGRKGSCRKRRTDATTLRGRGIALAPDPPSRNRDQDHAAS